MAGQYNLGSIEGVIKIGYKDDGVKAAQKDLDSVSKKGSSIGPALANTAKGVAAGGLLIAAGLTLAANSAANFEQRISAIKAVSGATATQMDAVRKKSLQLGKDTKFSAGEAASAIEELAKAGISLPDILNGAADATVNLAAAGEISLPEAATISANAMNAFGLSAKQMPRIADLIAGAANASAIDVGQFGQSLQQSGAVAHLAGVSFDDLSVAIAEMGNAGIKGSDAGTSIKTFLQNLIPTTKQQIELSKKLGLITKDGTNQFFDQTGKVKSLSKVSQVLQTALKGMSKEQQLATLQTLFGSDAIRAAAILAGNGAAGFDKLSKSMDKVKAADVAKTRMDNLKGSVEQLKGSAETLAIVVGESLQGALKGATDGLNRLLGFLITFAQNLPQIIASTKKLISQGLDKLKKAWNSEIVQRFVDSLVRLFNVLKGPITSLLRGMVGPAKNLAKIVGGALLVAFDLISRSMDKAADIAEFVKRNWDKIGPSVLALAAILTPVMIILLAQLVALGVGAIISAAKQVAAWALSQAAALKSIAVMIISSAIVVAQWIAMGIAATISAIRMAAAWLIALGPIGLVIAAIILVAGIIFLNFNRIKGWIQGAWNFVKSITTTAWNAVVNTLKSVLSSVITFFSQLPGRILRALAGLAGAMVGAGRSAMTGLLNGIKAILGAVLGFLAGLAGLFLRALSGAGTWLFSVGRAVIQGLINGIKSMAGAVAGAVRSAVGSAMNIAKTVLGVHSPSTVFEDIGQNVMQGFIKGIIGMRNDVVSAVGSSLTTPALIGPVTRSIAGGAGVGTGTQSTASGASVGGRVVNITNVNPRPVSTDEQVITSIRQLEALYG